MADAIDGAQAGQVQDSSAADASKAADPAKAADPKKPADAAKPEAPAQGGDSGGSVYRVLGLKRQLPALEEQALSEMLEGFHKLVRYLHGMISPAAASEPEPDEEPT